jgi:hypothetical protein
MVQTGMQRAKGETVTTEGTQEDRVSWRAMAKVGGSGGQRLFYWQNIARWRFFFQEF